MSAGTVALVSLGCAKNAVDLQNMVGGLVKKGYTLSPDQNRADVVIVNTCAFIASAREESESEIRRAIDMKRQGKYGRVVVAGCYPQRYPGAEAKFPGVDSWNGVPPNWVEPKIPGLRFTGKAFAYLKIAEGCSHRCSYCAIPSIRGKYRSRPVASIMREARALVESGCRELVIVAQDPMLYGIDLNQKRKVRIHDLLWKLDAIEGDFWVRVMYSYPSEITEDFIVWMMTSRHAVRYLDIPLQHTVPEVLERMNRKQAIEASLSVVDILRDIMPDATLRTTVMTGFPGESEARFKRLMADLKRMQFDHLGAFAYSPEEGTKGAKMRGRPRREVAEAREKAVMEQQRKIWRVKARRMVGESFRALVVAPGVARMASQAPDVDGVVYLVSGGCGKIPKTGDFITVRLVRVCGFDFEGEVEKA